MDSRLSCTQKPRFKHQSKRNVQERLQNNFGEVGCNEPSLQGHGTGLCARPRSTHQRLKTSRIYSIVVAVPNGHLRKGYKHGQVGLA